MPSAEGWLKQSTAVKSSYVFLPQVVSQKRKPQIDSWFLRILHILGKEIICSRSSYRSHKLTTFTNDETLAAPGENFEILTLYVVHTKIFVWPSQLLFCFLLSFSTSWKSCVKEQWPKKLLFQKCWHIVMICNLRSKKGWNIFEFLKSWQITESAKDNETEYVFSFWWTNYEVKQ